MTADATDPSRHDESVLEPSAAPPAAPPAGDTDLAPVPVESEGLADLLADPQIAPAEDSTQLADLLATPQEAAAVDQTPGLAKLLAEPDPTLFEGSEVASTASREKSASRQDPSANAPEPPAATGLPPLPALPPERPGPPPAPLAPEVGSGGYLGLIIVIVLILVVLLVGAIALIAVLVANQAWPFPISAAAAVLPAAGLF